MKNCLLVLTSILIMASGCTRYANITPEKLHKYPDNNIISINLPVRIVGFVSKADDTIYFDHNGGFYYPKSFHKLTGTFDDGEEYIGSIFSTKRIILRYTNSDKMLLRFLRPNQLFNAGRKWEIYPDSTAIMGDIAFYFDDSEGKVDFEKNTINGQINDNGMQEINISEISRLKVDRLKIDEKRYLLGVKVGAAVTHVSGSTNTNNAIYTTCSNKLRLGLNLIKKYSQIVYTQVELNYSSYGFTKSYADTFRIIEMAVNQDISFSYLDIPILTKFRLPNISKYTPSIYFGPVVGLVLSSNDKFDTTSIMRTEQGDYVYEYSGEGKIANFRRPSYGLILGGELCYNNGEMDYFLDIRYRFYPNEPFTDMKFIEKPSGQRLLVDINEQADKIRLNNLSIFLGIRHTI